MIWGTPGDSDALITRLMASEALIDTGPRRDAVGSVNFPRLEHEIGVCVQQTLATLLAEAEENPSNERAQSLVAKLASVKAVDGSLTSAAARIGSLAQDGDESS